MNGYILTVLITLGLSALLCAAVIKHYRRQTESTLDNLLQALDGAVGGCCLAHLMMNRWMLRSGKG